MVTQKPITDINGVYSSGIHAGFKAEKLDLSYIYVPEAVASAGVFTTNQFCSETIIHTKKIMKRNILKVMIINAGNANTGTGKAGKLAVKETVRYTSEKLGLKQNEVGIASTGIIGVTLPMDVMTTGLAQLLKNPLQTEGTKTAQAILTTDTCTKTVFLEKKIGKKTIQIAGICKGSGMIAPNMATMLAYIVTNVHIDNSQFQPYLKEAVDDSFNMITVDSDTSTSDMVVAFATGEHKISYRDQGQVNDFKSLLAEACQALSTQIVEDGEGASKLIELTVSGAATKQDAKKVAMSVLNSPLV
jgi:glutamate N-acetyltransferase/amino-acid N-acetyltransferase